MASKSTSGCSVAHSRFHPYLFLHFTSLSNSHLITKSLTVTTGWFSNWFALSARPLGNSYTVRTFPMGLVCNLTLFWHIFKGGPRKKNTVYNYILSVASIRWYTESLKWTWLRLVLFEMMLPSPTLVSCSWALSPTYIGQIETDVMAGGNNSIPQP